MEITGADHAIGANLAAIVAALVAAGVFFHRWWGIHSEKQPHLKVAAWAYLVIAFGMLLTGIQRTYWHLYYLAIEHGWHDIAALTVRHQNVAATLLLVWALIGVGHVRFALERFVGAVWWVAAVGIVFTAYVIGVSIGG